MPASPCLKIEYFGGQPFRYGHQLAVAGHEDQLPGYVVKWGEKQFTFFEHRADMAVWFQRTKEDYRSRREAFMPLEVVCLGQRCGFYADIECITPPEMTADEIDTLKAEIMEYINDAYFDRGFDNSTLMWSENHRRTAKHPGIKISFHVVGRDVDFEDTRGNSHLAHVAAKMNRDCLKLTKKYPLVCFSESKRTGKKENLFDLKVYTKNRAMRCIYSSKEGSEDSWFKPCAGFEGRELREWMIVRDAGSTLRLHTEPWTSKDEEELLNVKPSMMTKKTYNAKAFKRHMQSHTENIKATDAQDSLARRLQAYFQEEQEDGTISVRFYGEYHRGGKQPADSYRLDGKNRNCLSCGKIHTSNGAGKCRC